MESVKRSWKLQEFVAHRANVNCLAMGHKSNQVLATGGDDKKVNLWAIGRYSCLMSLSGHTTPVESVSFSHSEDLVCAGSQAGALKIWDLEAAKLLRTFTGHKGAIKCMDFHPYGDYLSTGSCDSNIKLWDTRKKGCIVTYSGHRLAVNSLQFSPDGQWIASACDDGLVKVWDVRVGKVLKEFHEHTAPVTCIKFHPHEFLLASTAADRTVNFWDMEKFQLVSKFENEHFSISHLLFSEDGTCVLGGGGDGLHVVCWEPARAVDRVPAKWGPVHDMTVAHNQLIAGSFHSTYVVMSVVDLSKVHPFGGSPPLASPVREVSPFQKGSSVRKSFSKERPPKDVMHAKTLLDEKTIEETSGTEAEEESGAVIANYSDYREIFRPSRALNRTPPPPCTSDTADDVTDMLAEELSLRTTSLRDLSLSDLTVPSPPHSAPTSLEGRGTATSLGPVQRGKTDAALAQSRIPTSTKDLLYPVNGVDKTKTDRTEISNKATRYDDTQRRISPTRPVLNRQHSYKESSKNNSNNNGAGGPLRSSNSDVSLAPSGLGARSASFSRNANESSRTRKISRTNQQTQATSLNVDIYTSAPQQTKERRQLYTSSQQANDRRDIDNRDTERRDNDKQDIDRRDFDSRGREAEPEFVPIATDRPVGLDLDDFLPKSQRGHRRTTGSALEPSEQEVLAVMMGGYDSMIAILRGRQRSMQIFHSVRVNKNLKTALESMIALGDMAVLVDILNVMANKPSLWNLDICALMLPIIQELLQSKYEFYMTTGCGGLRLILRNFAPVIKSNVSSPVCSLGVDIPREERYSKCLQLHHQLLDVRAFLLKRQTLQGRLGAAFRDLHSLIEQGLDCKS